MKNLFNSLLKPQAPELMWFTIVFSALITTWLWFDSALVMGWAILSYIILLALGGVALVICLVVDSRFQTSLSRYAKRGLVVFVALLVIEIPIQAGLQALSDDQGNRARQLLEAYYNKHGEYPSDLNAIQLTSSQRRTWFGTSLEYSKGLTPFLLSYRSIGGYQRFFSHQDNCWSYPFDL